MHFTVMCCTNKCIINERYIPEHQNKLNIYDLQNYEFLPNFFQLKIKFYGVDSPLRGSAELSGGQLPLAGGQTP